MNVSNILGIHFMENNEGTVGKPDSWYSGQLFFFFNIYVFDCAWF